MIIGWRTWVDTPKGVVTFDSKLNAWTDVLDDGVLYKMLYGDTKQEPNLNRKFREQQQGIDSFFEAPHRDGTIYGSSNETVAEIEARYPGAVVKRGKWVPEETLRNVVAEAIKYDWYA